MTRLGEPPSYFGIFNLGDFLKFFVPKFHVFWGHNVIFEQSIYDI